MGNSSMSLLKTSKLHMNPSRWRLTTTSLVSLLSSRSGTSLLQTPESSRSTLMCSTLRWSRHVTGRRNTRTCPTTSWTTCPASLSEHVPARHRRNLRRSLQISGGKAKKEDLGPTAACLDEINIKEPISRCPSLDFEAFVAEEPLVGGVMVEDIVGE